MSTSNKLPQQFPERRERIAVIFATIISWIAVGLIYRYGSTSAWIGLGTLWGPCTLLLTYFFFGGDIPAKWRRKGFRRLMAIPVVFWLSFLPFVIVVHFFPPHPK